MHILVTADTIGGVWTYARELVTGLVRRGIKVTLVSFGEIPAPQQTRWMDDLENLDFRPTAFRLEWMQDSEADLAASAEYLESIVRECRPDVLHLNQFYYGDLHSDVPRLVVAHSDVVNWWVAVHQKEPPESRWMRWYREAVSRGIANATAVAAPSRWMLAQIERHYCKPESGSVVYNGRSPGLFNPHMSKDDLLVTVGRLWDSGKNAALLLRQDLPVPVCIVGTDKHPESQGRAFGGRRTGVQFQAQQNEGELSRTFARASIYAATSRYEPFGLAPVEAALSRCAIVASDIAPFRELWEGAAVFFRDDDAESLRDAVLQLANDPGLRRHYGNLAYNHARQKFNADRMVDDYLNLYKTMTGVAALSA